MAGTLSQALYSLLSRKRPETIPSPLLVELLERVPSVAVADYTHYPFAYYVGKTRSEAHYAVGCSLPEELIRDLRRAVQKVGDGLDPESVQPLTFDRLVEVLCQSAAAHLGNLEGVRIVEISELVAYEAIGLSRMLALAKDSFVTEFYVDSDSSPLYLDHSRAGRCETSIMLTERERRALETHMDTFRGYTLDYATPSLKNDLEIAGSRLRVSLDLSPTCVNRFALDVRRLDVSAFTLRELIRLDVLSVEAAAFLVAWLETGGNVTVVGETGTGKTTLMNALDEQVDPRLRRVYIEDAVETKDLLGKGYHQMKIKVDPYDRGGSPARSKESEIVKVLHRSPDLVVLSEIQSEEHSRAFFHALSAGVRGIQTFHASSVEQAIRRWTSMHGIQAQGLLDLGVLVQMRRPDRLGPSRQVFRVCALVSDSGEPKVREVFARDRDHVLRRVADWGRVAPPGAGSPEEFVPRAQAVSRSLGEESGRQS